jgi:hypothetical protein
MSYRFINEFIGYGGCISRSISFLGLDTQKTFLKNKNELGPEWYYYNRPIEYKFNQLGHRSREIDDLDLNNYFLVSGCSMTAGVGLEKEHTYHELISKDLNITHYNLALGGTGNDVIFFNLLQWSTTFKNNPPKFVIVQWTDPCRYSLMSKEHIEIFGPYIADPILVTETSNRYFFYKTQFFRKMIKKIFTCPIYEIGWTNFAEPEYQTTFYSDCIYMMPAPNDRARDLTHPGIHSHRTWKEQLLNTINV